MTPGLTRWNSDIRSGDITAVTLENGVPIAVGVAAFDVGRLSKATGEKGKAIYLLHCYNDELWALGSKSHPPTEVLPSKSDQLEEALQQLSLEPEAPEDRMPAVITEKRSEDQPPEVGEDGPSVAGLLHHVSS
jgi:translation initiation factor 2D